MVAPRFLAAAAFNAAIALGFLLPVALVRALVVPLTVGLLVDLFPYFVVCLVLDAANSCAACPISSCLRWFID